MYFKDFAAYSYGTYYGRDRIIPLDEVRTIGWLENGHEHQKGQVDEQSLFNLRKLLVMSPRSAKQAKGFHICDLCVPTEDRLARPKITFEGKELTLGSSELWIPSASSKNLIYAAPNLIYHYIVEHSYLPPNEFLDAVNSFDMDSDWNAYEQYRTILEQHRERIRKAEQQT
jgi:hypothetical protein